MYNFSKVTFRNLNLFRSEFSKNVLTLLSGVFIAQAVPFLLSPVLSRLYSPSDFGEYAIFNSFIGVLIIIATARFEFAIALPKEDENAFRLVKMILVLSVIISLMTFIIFLISKAFIVRVLNIKDGSKAFYLIPVSVLLISVFQSLTYYFNRKKYFRLQAVSKLSSTFGQSTFSLLFGFFGLGSLGLILSYIIGQVSGSVALASKVSNREFSSLKILEYDELKSLAKRYKKFPTLMTFGSLLNSISAQLPIFMITSLFSTEIVGAMSFAQTMVVVPTGLISLAFADVLRQRAVEEFSQTGTCRPLLMRTIKKLFIIGIVPFLVLFFVAPILFSFLFGEQWILAGEFARIMTLMFFLRFVFMSVSGTVIIVTEKLEYDIFWQIGYLLFTFFAIYAGNLFFSDIKKVLFLLTLVSSVFYLLSFFMAYRFSQRITDAA